MTEQMQIEKLKNAFGRALPIPPDEDFDGLQYAIADGWDSVAHMQLIAEIEVEFDIMLSTEDVIGMSSFAKAREIVARYVPLEA
jgi:acyl carrier protein